MEAIALHSASSYGGAQFYISCGQVSITGGGSGKPGPLVAIPGVYTGNEPGILLNIYYPIPANYTQPGPVSKDYGITNKLIGPARLYGQAKYRFFASRIGFHPSSPVGLLILLQIFLRFHLLLIFHPQFYLNYMQN